MASLCMLLCTVLGFWIRFTCTSEGSDCCFIIPRLWMSACRNISLGTYWSGLVLGSCIFVSAHILDHLVEDGRAVRVFEETINYAQNVRRDAALSNVIRCST